MNWWVYKCNSLGHVGRVSGDWAEFFDAGPGGRTWGDTKSLPALKRLSPGDSILAYQTNTNELLGLAQVVGFKRGGRLVLRPLKRIQVKVRPLKKADPRIAAIPAFKPGLIRTIYQISDQDAQSLLRAAGVPEPLPLGPEPKTAPSAFIINSNRRHRGDVWEKMIEAGVACTGGSIKYGRYLRRLTKGSRVFLFVNKVGVVAEGVVTSEWSGRPNKPLKAWEHQNMYSVGVKWTKWATEQEAVTVEELRRIGLSQFRITLFAVTPAIADKISARLPDRTAAPLPPEARRTAGGFGDPEQNTEVEDKSVAFVTKRFERQGWQVTPVGAENRGYDLLCQRGGEELHVEVKGTTGDGRGFIITANEKSKAENDERFLLCVVANALSPNSSCRELTGAEFLRQFRLLPIQYKATARQEA